jgi:hypothetical protein
MSHPYAKGGKLRLMKNENTLVRIGLKAISRMFEVLVVSHLVLEQNRR